MFSTIFWGSVVIFGSIAYGVMKGDTRTTYVDKKKVSNEEETFKYFGNLPLEYQEKYFNNNLDLKSYKNDSSVGFTDNKYLNAKHAAEISKRTGKKFNNINKTY